MAENDTTGADFLLVGFLMSQKQGVIAFTIFLFIYTVTIMANILIIVLVRMDQSLHKPMYFFLSNFSFLEIWYITTIVPKMLADILSKRRLISHNGCITQLYFFFVFGAMENLLLGVMALDRFLAICYPLHYPIFMNDRTFVQLTGGCWVFSCVSLLLPAVSMYQLSFCGPLVIDHVFCDFSPLMKLSCKRNSLSEVSFTIISWIVILCCFFLIMMSYIFIIVTILRMSSTARRQNAFATCASHLMVVLIYYGSAMFIYIRPPGHESFPFDKVLFVFCVVATPLMNPIIYSLRNQEVKTAMKRMIARLKVLRSPV
ncbi:olfactory receptor 6Y1-like [Microcaecilia unicolor]|uniref:Olfactory receptor n=1 Tax=Microcaecilia unicolor TaxID=1415580 RepID=A0A6P7WN67_9AMPH|nr:olfactory receptor 6Y1-like [Microcaecilia unicolor]